MKLFLFDERNQKYYNKRKYFTMPFGKGYYRIRSSLWNIVLRILLERVIH